MTIAIPLALTAIAGILLLALTGCSHGPDYYSPVPIEQGYAPAYGPYDPRACSGGA